MVQLILLLGALGLIIYLSSMDARTLKKRDRRYKSGYRNTGIEIEVEKLLKLDYWHALGALLMTPFFIFIIPPTRDVGYFSGWVLIIIWGTVALFYYNDRKKLNEKMYKYNQMKLNTSNIISKLEANTDSVIGSSQIKRYKSIPKSCQAKEKLLSSYLSNRDISCNLITINYQGIYWGSNYSIYISKNIIENETVIIIKKSHRNSVYSVSESEFNRSIVLTGEYISLALSLRYMEENKSLYDQDIKLNPYPVDHNNPDFLQFLTFKYSDISYFIKESRIDIEEKIAPTNVSCVSKRYKYQRMDGGPDRRYSDNPLILNCRAWEITIQPPIPMQAISIKFIEKSKADDIKHVLDALTP
ncbi:hypothetical protein GCM10008956_30240 [Deinococcus arenae]|uniref:Uncharacterized protein n=1 Tax=Deinococcus arenae TaxID=1452751 RepID=A0A8H9L832_9DEIO|nr:hypothetical protein [Deinococcus arenae]GGM52094.1 hypothetical protein GCM10008956_30240 [Deinococcus arenae]